MKKTTLYLGLDPINFKTKNNIIHCPLIQIIPRNFESVEITSTFVDIPQYTHIIFTSKNSVKVFFQCLKHYKFSFENIKEKQIIAIGKATASLLQKEGISPLLADEETQEGVVTLLALQDIDNAYFFLPQSSLARSSILHFFMLRGIRHQRCYLYDTTPKIPSILPNIEEVDEIVFTSPSTVDAFVQAYGAIPKNKELTSIGPITKSKLLSVV